MKYVKSIIVLLIFSIFTSFAYDSTIPQNCDDCCFRVRWTDFFNVKLYSQEFYVDVHLHENLDSYISPPYDSNELGDCPPTVFCNPQMPDINEVFQRSVGRWNGDVSLEDIGGIAPANSTFNIRLQTDPVTGEIERISNTDVVVEDDFKNIIGFDEEDYYADGSLVQASCIKHLPETVWDCNNPIKPSYTARGADIIFNSSLRFDEINLTGESSWLDYLYYDFESILMHELGHFAGLCHPKNASADNDKILMNGNLYNCHIRRGLHQLDILALETLYPFGDLNGDVNSVDCLSFLNSDSLSLAAEKSQDIASQRPDDGIGGGVGSCRVQKPSKFDATTKKNMISFTKRNFKQNINLFIRRLNQNPKKINEILSSRQKRYETIQALYTNMVNTNKQLIEATVNKDEKIILTEKHLDPLCEFLDELVFLIEKEEFNKEDLFLSEIDKLKKGMVNMIGKDLKTALMEYDVNLKIEDEEKVYTCNKGFKKSSAPSMMDGENNFRIYLDGNIIKVKHTFNTNEPIELKVVSINGQEMISEILSLNRLNINVNQWSKGMYLVIPIQNGAVLNDQIEKITVL